MLLLKKAINSSLKRSCLLLVCYCEAKKINKTFLTENRKNCKLFKVKQ